MEARIRKLWCAHAMEHYSATKNDEILPFATTCVDLERLTLSEIGQMENDKNHVIHSSMGFRFVVCLFFKYNAIEVRLGNIGPQLIFGLYFLDPSYGLGTGFMTKMDAEMSCSGGSLLGDPEGPQKGWPHQELRRVGEA